MENRGDFPMEKRLRYEELEQIIKEQEKSQHERQHAEKWQIESIQILATICEYTHFLVAYLDPKFNFSYGE